MNQRALVLSSGGVDSTTCIAVAIEKYGKSNVETVSFNYGQKHTKELERAKRIAEYYQIPHIEIDLRGTNIFEGSNCSLLEGSSEEIKHKSYEEQIKEDGKVNSYVPFRNGLMLASVASLAFSRHPKDRTYIYLGAHADDATGNAYADCTPIFTKSMDMAIWYGTYNQVSLESPFIDMNKSEIVAEGLRLGVPYELTWSCYEGKDKACGTCGTCRDRLKAFEINKVEDPIEYDR